MVIKETTADETMAATNNSTGNGDTAQPSTNKTIIIGQEIKFARTLAGNDPKLRRKVLKNLKTWLKTRSQSTFAFTDADFLRLWKGLFYCMWMSDKPLVQEEVAEMIGSLVRCFDNNVPVAMQFYKSFMLTMGLEWFGIDRWRMDKFMMFVRRVTRQMLFVLHCAKWQTEHVKLLVEVIETTVLNPEVSSFGLTNHFNDLILEEIAKVSDGKVPKEVITQILEPYVCYVLKNTDGTIISGIVKNIFFGLMQQSDLGQLYEEKFNVWKQMGFVTGDIDKVQFNVKYEYGDDDTEEQAEDADETEDEEQDEKEVGTRQRNGWTEQDEKDENQEEDNSADENEEEEAVEEKVYDPRAGRVNVVIPQIDFDPKDIISLLEKHRYKSYATTRGKKSASRLVRQLNQFANGVYPLGIKRVPNVTPKHYEVDIDQQVRDIEQFEAKLCTKTNKSWKERKREKQQRRKLLRKQKEAEMAAAKEAQNGTHTDTPGDDASIAGQDESDASGDPVVKKPKSKKNVKQRKKSPLAVKKKLKLDMLNSKNKAKFLVLKERLKSLKSTVSTTANGDAAHDLPAGEKLPSASSLKQPKESPAKEGGSPESAAKKKAEKKNKKATKKEDKKPFHTVDEWSEPLKEGEEEYFIPSRKMKTKQPSFSSSPTDSAKTSKGNKQALKRTPPTPTAAASSVSDPETPARKRVKIALNKNIAQDLVEHIEQVKSSPKMPFDSSAKPTKSLLKPNLIPSPINPFYKKKIGLK